MNERAVGAPMAPLQRLTSAAMRGDSNPGAPGGSDHVASVVGTLGRHAGAIAHRLEQSCHQAFHIFPAELAHAVLDELDAVVVRGGECLIVTGGDCI